jgi:competence protein ComGC
MSKSNQVVSEKSCDVTVKLLQSQVAAYEIEKEELPATLNDLVLGGYVDSVACPGGETLILEGGEVKVETTETPISP